METSCLLVVLLFSLLLMTKAQVPGFVNIDCGGTDAHTDDIGLQWTPDNSYLFGAKANTSFADSNKTQYKTVRNFPSDDRKYCYVLNVTTGLRYLVRATFFYGNFDNTNVYPKFLISLGATLWDLITIKDAQTPVVSEMVLLAPTPYLSVCLLNASSGVRFISTIELRRFNGSMYANFYENQFFRHLAARVNFGALSDASIRYPDDPFDRIWESDTIKRPNYLVDVAPGTEKVSTDKPIFVDHDERPPMKVMQTAVVGNNGTLSYRMNIEIPGNAWAFTYMAEIEELSPNETRQFKVELPWGPPVNDAVVNVQENANGSYRLYEPGFTNVSLPFIASLLFRQTNDSTRGPILNAFEVFKYVLIDFGSPDATAMTSLVESYPQAMWAQEGGDPCSPTSWTWIKCNSDSQPQIISLNLSKKNLTGTVPIQLTRLTGLVELYLNDNAFTGSIPDFGGCPNLQIIHLENNELTGALPVSLANLPNLKELYVQNNRLSGMIPKGLVTKNHIFNYSGNPGLYPGREAKRNLVIIVVPTVGALLLLLFLAACCLRKCKKKGRKRGKLGHLPAAQLNLLDELDAEPAHRFELSEIEDATDSFKKVLGKGGFGSVYYGKLNDGREIAVKVHNAESNQGIHEFKNEITLLSRIHHRNLVKFLGYSQQESQNVLVYEFMHEGTLTGHLRGDPEKKIVSWMKRLEIAEDAAKGIEYLHTGCSPAIIHRDLKSSNILLDNNMKAKVSDFGLSKLMAEESNILSMVKGTLGYLDPEYYTTHQFTVKADIFSFGIILLELIAGFSPISDEHFGADFHYIVEWAREHIESGNIHAIIDKSLEPTYDILSVWKITEVALMCVKPTGMERPSISEVLKEIQDAILIEQKAPTSRVESIDIFARKPLGSAPNCSMSNSALYAESLVQPGLR